jgi:alanine racemase
MQLKEILNIVNGELLQDAHRTVEITKFVIDSRKATGLSQEAFIAIEGLHNDGHDFIDQVYQKGTRFFLVEKAIALPKDAIGILVDQGIEALQRLAKYHREKYHYPVVGITGSNGKTTVKEWLSFLLSRQFRVVKSPKSYNSEVGVPLSLLTMADDDIGIFEAGISGQNQMHVLESLIQPTLGIFTNIGKAHDEGFENMDQKIEEKCVLFEACDTIICCHDHLKLFDKLSTKFGSRLISWSYRDKEASYYFRKAEHGYYYPQADVDLNFPFSEAHAVENALHATVAALELGISPHLLSEELKYLKPIPMRLELKKAINGCFIIDDSYNNDLVGLEVALDFMNTQSLHQPKTLIITDILQSGMKEELLYKEVEKLILNKGVQRLITIGIESGKHLNAKFHFNDAEHFLRDMPVFKDETILLKGARKYQLERIAERLEETTHGTILQINFEALRNNLNSYRERLQDSTKLMVMVKAFAYGSGLGEIATFLEQERVDYLGVAYVDEAVQLRKKGITLPIMIMNPQIHQFRLCETYNLEPEIYNLSMLTSFIDQEIQTALHLKLETGMNRLGFTEDQLDELISQLTGRPDIHVKSIFTHFSSSDDPSEDAYTHKQASIFQRMTRRLMAALAHQPMLHAVNSTGMVRFPEYHFDMARLGIGLYGFDPTEEIHTEPVAKLSSRISQIRSLKAGASIGYGRAGRVLKDTRMAVLPIGYADGYPRSLGNGKAFVRIGQEMVPTVGNVCMDMTMIDIGDLACEEGDEVILLGDRPSLQDVADWAGTIPYEILTGISQRVKRTYVSE